MDDTVKCVFVIMAEVIHIGMLKTADLCHEHRNVFYGQRNSWYNRQGRPWAASNRLNMVSM